MYSSPNIIKQIKSRTLSWRDMWKAWERREKCTEFWWGRPKEDNLEDQGIDGRMGSELMLGRLSGSVEWIQLVQDRGRWRAAVNTVMNLRVLVPRI
jgi:hypothetical protein